MTELAERIAISGVVQGVGYRPFVFRVANQLGLRGRVYNDASDVIVEVAGPSSGLDCLAASLSEDAPPLARIASLQRQPISARGVTEERFVITASRDEQRRVVVPPDAAVCDRCLAEMNDPTNRRHRHPFITCTDCGPRFTIIRDLPYDRGATTMAHFEMCERCRQEYEDPDDRRHHAQPIACHDCGPVLWAERAGLEVAQGEGVQGDAAQGEDALECAVDALARGQVVAIKGIGGFHLACDATDDAAVAVLRGRKHRPDKPFAVMVPDLAAACALAHVGPVEARELESSARPIVLVRARRSTAVSHLVAPENPLIGIVLAYSPIHHLVLAKVPTPLVMTSANIGGEPIIHRDDEPAMDQLHALADVVLTHDRPIVAPCDDSVVRIVDGDAIALRRARGHAPLPVVASGAGRVVAAGADLKNTFCLADDGRYWLGQHIGDMGSPATLRAFEDGIARFSGMYGVEPTVVAADRHPRYVTSRWARTQRRCAQVSVQHHHAHIASVMAEHDLDPHADVLGFAFDGTGYGDDGSIWGGEVMIANGLRARRVAHLRTVSIPGGDIAVEQPRRSALGHLAAAGVTWEPRLAPVESFEPAELQLLGRQLDRGVACTSTSSMGRLFDAAASLLALRQRVTFEAHAAADLEIAAAQAEADGCYPFPVDGEIIDPSPVIGGMVADLDAGVPTDVIARRFHESVVEMVAGLAHRLTATHDVAAMVMSGGVFQNALLVGRCRERLGALGVPVLMNRVVPPNDGGLALGQAFVAANRRPQEDLS